MKVRISFISLVLIALVVSALCWPPPHWVALAQQPEETTRKLWDTAFTSSATTKKTSRRRTSGNYRVATPTVSVENVAPDTVVGVTVWRLRPAKAADSGERLIVHDGADTRSWLPERVSANAKLVQGDRIRISIEAARTGYLYVIDREQYADGSLGEPYLIFPTTRVLSGDNRVTLGKLTEIPAQEDSPPYFTVKKTRPDHVAEVMSVLISPTPLDGIQITEKAQRLSDSQLATWEKSWSTGVGWMEMEGGSGRAWTKEEKEAGAGTTRALTSNAPVPQLLFYRSSASVNQPMLVNVHLWYQASPRRTNH